jgi:hypothetical protein
VSRCRGRRVASIMKILVVHDFLRTPGEMFSLMRKAHSETEESAPQPTSTKSHQENRIDKS